MNQRNELRGLMGRCPSEWKITRALSEPSLDTTTGTTLDPKLDQHLRVCPVCAAKVRDLRALLERAADMPAPRPMTGESRAAISARLLTRDLADSGTRVPWSRFSIRSIMAMGLATAAVALVAVGGWPKGGWPKGGWPKDPSPMARPSGPSKITASVPSPEDTSERPRAMPGDPSLGPGLATHAAPAPALASFAKIRAIGGALFERVSAPPDEIVRVQEGRVFFEVSPLGSGDRFRVVTKDGDVEVRGTAFETAVAAGRLSSVIVFHGRVEVRTPKGQVVLETGDEWRSGPSATETRSAGAPPNSRSAVAQPARALETRPKTASQKPGGDSFDKAWSQLRSGNAEGAAKGFEALAQTSRGQTIEEDAVYWQAVATARLGKHDEARHIFEDFLKRFPTSHRTGEAADALGWILLESGERARARAMFDRAATDISPRVRASAAEGKQRIESQE